MDSIDVMKVCLRRWYVVLPVLLLAAASAVGLTNSLKPTYYAVGSYAFVYTHADAIKVNQPDPRNLNPLVAGGPQLLGEAVMADLTSAATQAQLGGKNRGYGPQNTPDGSHYSINAPAQGLSYDVQTWADTNADAARVLQSVLLATRATTANIQTRVGAPADSRYTPFVTSPTRVIELPPQSRLKFSVAIMFVGLLVGAGASLLFERLAQRRRESPVVFGPVPVVARPAPPEPAGLEPHLPEPADLEPHLSEPADLEPHLSEPAEFDPHPFTAPRAKSKPGGARTPANGPKSKRNGKVAAPGRSSDEDKEAWTLERAIAPFVVKGSQDEQDEDTATTNEADQDEDTATTNEADQDKAAAATNDTDQDKAAAAANDADEEDSARPKKRRQAVRR